MNISIVIPLYNKEKHILDTIKCIENQTFKNYEIIVVNDGSTDNSQKIVESYTGCSLRIISQKNQGAAHARNVGVKSAKFDYVAFLDADDYWESNYLESMVNLIEEYPDAGIYGSNYTIIENGKSHVLEYPGIVLEKGYIENYFISGKMYTPLWTSAVIIKKELFIKLGGFPTKCKVCEDIDLWCRIAATQKIAYINKPLARYIRDSINMLSRTKNVSYNFPFLDNYNNYISTNDELYDSVMDYSIYRKFMAISFALLTSYNKNEAKELLKQVGYPKKYLKKSLGYRLFLILPNKILKIYCRLR